MPNAEVRDPPQTNTRATLSMKGHVFMRQILQLILIALTAAVATPAEEDNALPMSLAIANEMGIGPRIQHAGDQGRS